MKIEKIKMPQLGESVTEGTIGSWLVSVGDFVDKYDPLAEVMTDKVNAEIPSSFSGKIKELIAAEGDTLSVGEIICTIEVVADADSKLEDTKNEGHDNGKLEASIMPAIPPSAAETQQAQSKMHYYKVRYSPAVLKLSQEHHIDLSLVQGSGAEGGITRKDLLKLVDSRNEIPKPQAQASNKAEGKQQQPAANSRALWPDEQESQHRNSQPTATSIAATTGDLEIPVTGVRKVIARNMLRSIHEIPHAWTMIEADVTNLVELRNSLKDEFNQKEGYNLTYFAFFVKAVAQALKDFPQINSMWAGGKIIQKKDINISIAVATDAALFVPVIRNADEKSIKGIAREISEFAQKVRSGKLTPEDMRGGTFTVNNTGSFGSVQSMGIINYPQAAILQVESIMKRPVVLNNNSIAIRDIVNLCMSLDHRSLDGLICGRFLQRLKELLEKISKENTSIY